MTQETQQAERTAGVVVACRRGDGRWLLIRRSATVRRPLQVCFPGGWIEAGESQHDAAVREMQEELGAAVVPLRCVWQNTFGEPSRVLWGWLAELTSSNLTPNQSEVHEILWLTPDEAIRHPDVIPGTAAFLAALCQEEPVKQPAPTSPSV